MAAFPSIQTLPGETRCDVVDRLPPALRALVHEYGASVVTSFVENGVRRPEVIRTLIRAVHVGAREPGNARPAAARLPGKGALAHLDAWLVAHGATFTAQMVVRAIRDSGFTVLPTMGPTQTMVQASEAAVSGGNVKCTRQEKHQRRLQAAMVAGDREAWGDL